jgi:predicted ester cyclase
MPQDNKKLIRNAVDVVNKKDHSALKKMVHPGLREAFVDAATQAHAAFPDLKIVVDDVITEGDKSCIRWHADVTHKGKARHGKLGSVKPTGKKATVTGITINRIENGVVVETWGSTDTLEALEQLGLVADYAKAVGGKP